MTIPIERVVAQCHCLPGFWFPPGVIVRVLVLVFVYVFTDAALARGLDGLGTAVIVSAAALLMVATRGLRHRLSLPQPDLPGDL